MEKFEWKKAYKRLYSPPSQPVVVEVPPLHFLMIDGHGDPNKEKSYQEAVETLFSLSYALKFAVKKEQGIDYRVFPLEGIWWVKDMRRFTTDDKTSWDWTMMIAQPEAIREEWIESAKEQVLKKRSDLGAIEKVRFEVYSEGLSVQLMHIGPYSAEGPNVARIHSYIYENGYEISGKHHEIYLSDVRRSAPEKLKTVIRQPICLC